MGSGCGSIGRAVVASNSRGPQFESSHRKKFITNINFNCFEKTKIKKKRPGMAHLNNETRNSRQRFVNDCYRQWKEVAFTPWRIMGRNMVVYIGTERSIFYHQVQRVIFSMWMRRTATFAGYHGQLHGLPVMHLKVRLQFDENVAFSR